MISVGGDTRDIRLLFSLRMAKVAREWRDCTDEVSRGVGRDGYALIPLYHLKAHPAGLTQAELARRMRIAESSATRLVAALLKDGFISRQRMAGDGRAWLIRLEKDGADLIRSFEPQAKALRGRLLDDFTDADIVCTNRVLSVLGDRLISERDALSFQCPPQSIIKG